jgi:hypothetical protein
MVRLIVSLLGEKSINLGLLLIFILLIVIFPLPFKEDSISLGPEKWRFVAYKDVQYNGENYPLYNINKGVITIETPYGSSAYLENEVKIPDRGLTFSCRIYHRNDADTTIFLADSKNIYHGIRWTKNLYTGFYEMDVSSYAGQKVKIELHQSSDTKNANIGTGYYDGMEIRLKEFTLYDSCMLFVTTLRNIVLFSLIIGFITGFSGSPIFSQLTDKFQDWMTKNYNIILKNDKWYSKYYLKTVFSIGNKILIYTNKISNLKIRTSIITATMLGLPIMIIYITKVIVFIIIFIVAIALVLYLIFYIFGSIGPSFSGGGGSSSGSGGGRSSSPSGAIFGSSYEKTAKEESRPFKVDKESRSSEGAWPFGIGGDTIYKTEYEDTSTGETVKGHGWTRSEADFNARKNLKNK